MRFEILRGIGPLPIKLGMSQEDICDLFGSPLRKEKNFLGELTWDFGDCSICFGKDGAEVIEVGFSPTATVMLEEIDLFRQENAFEEIVKGTAAFEYLGFIVLPELGLTFTGFHDGNDSDKAITVFKAGRWDHLRPSFQLYKNKMNADKRDKA